MQGRKLSDVQILRSNGTNVLEVPVGEDDHEVYDSSETWSLNVTEEESKVIEETNDDINLVSSS